MVLLKHPAKNKADPPGEAGLRPPLLTAVTLMLLCCSQGCWHLTTRCTASCDGTQGGLTE